MKGRPGWNLVLVGITIMLIAGAVAAIQTPPAPQSQPAWMQPAGPTTCTPDPTGPEIVGHNQTYEHHWIREGVNLDFQVQCAGGQAPFDIWWEVNDAAAQSGAAFTFDSAQWGRDVYSVDAYCVDSAGYCAHQPFHVEVFDEDAFTIVLLPDTQYYAKPGRSQFGGPGSGSTQMFYDQTEWIVASREALDMVWTAHLGDVVEGCCRAQQCTPPQSDTPPAECLPVQCPTAPEDPPYTPTWEEVGVCQWARGDIAMTALENAGIPHSIAVGNHDYGPPIGDGLANRDMGLFDMYFPPVRWELMANSIAHYGEFGFLEDSELEPPLENTASNSYHIFSTNGLNFLLIAHEYQPRPEIEDWVLSLLDTYSDHRVIITRHSSDSPSTEAYPNVFLHAWGHHAFPHGTLFSTAASDLGTPVYRMGVNYQFQDHGGNGYLRFLVFEPDRDLVTARTYSPYRDLNPHESYPPIKQNVEEHLQNFDFPYLMSSDSVPVISASHPPVGGPPGSLAIHLSGSQSFSYGSGVEITGFRWDFGDGHYGSGSEVEHIYEELGEYSVGLTIFNNLAQTASTSITLDIPLGTHWQGDADQDGYVDGQDLDYVLQNFGAVTSEDVTGTGVIDEYDVLSVLCNWGRITGDVNRDCIVDGNDLLEVENSMGECPWPCMQDIAGNSVPTPGPDGVVDGIDWIMVSQNFGISYSACHLPPSSIEMKSVDGFIDPDWLTQEDSLDVSACELLVHWFGNPAYE